MSELATFFGTILLTLAVVGYTLKRAIDAVAADAKVAYDRVGRIWFVGGIIQWKIRKSVDEFRDKVFDKETPEEKEKAMKVYLERDFQKRRREERKQHLKSEERK